MEASYQAIEDSLAGRRSAGEGKCGAIASQRQEPKIRASAGFGRAVRCSENGKSGL